MPGSEQYRGWLCVAIRTGVLSGSISIPPSPSPGGAHSLSPGGKGNAEPPAFLSATAPPQYRPLVGSPPTRSFRRPREGSRSSRKFSPILLRPQLPPASTVCWRPRRIRRVYVRAAGGGCGRACAQGGARTIYSCMGWRLLSMRSGCRPFEPPPIILGSISKAPPWPGQRALPPPRLRCCN